MAALTLAIGHSEGGPHEPYLDPPAEFFDRASVPPQIQELLDEWPEIDLARRGSFAPPSCRANHGDCGRRGGCCTRGPSWRGCCARATRQTDLANRRSGAQFSVRLSRTVMCRRSMRIGGSPQLRQIPAEQARRPIPQASDRPSGCCSFANAGYFPAYEGPPGSAELHDPTEEPAGDFSPERAFGVSLHIDSSASRTR